MSGAQKQPAKQAQAQQKTDVPAQGTVEQGDSDRMRPPTETALRGEPPTLEDDEDGDDGDETDIYHVVGPGSIIVGTGEQRHVYRAGDMLELSEKEAESLGDAVALGEPPPPPAPVERRAGGRYRVGGPGGIIVGGRFYGPGEVLELSAAEARSLGQVALERVK